MSDQGASDYRPVWQRGWFIGLVVLVVLGVIVAIIISQRDADDDAPAPAEIGTAEPGDEPETEAPPEGAAPPDGGAMPLEERYPEFEAVEESGSGDATVELPADVTAGIVTATHDGEDDFWITAISENETDEVLVARTGAYEGTTGFRLAPEQEDIVEDRGPVTLEVVADGDWNLTVEPVTAAPELELPASGDGDAVFRYLGDIGSWSVQHSASPEFRLIQYGGLLPGMLVEGQEPGAESVVEPSAGPSLVQVMADGEWSISEADPE